jgi:hypothetical protein
MPLAVLVFWGGMARADDVVVPHQDLMKTLSAVATPGAEHAKLQPLVGSWTYTCKFWLEPNAKPMESKGTIERRFVLGGRFLEEIVRGTNFDGTPGFEGLGLLGYDIPQRKYTLTWLSSMGTGTSTGLGVVDSSGTLFTFQTEGYCPIQKQIVKGRDEVRIENPDRIVMESYLIENGKERKVLELVALRKK